MMEVSCFDRINITAEKCHCSPLAVIESIRIGGKDGLLKEAVEVIRKFPGEVYNDYRRDLKRKYLPVVTWQGLFHKRSNDGVDGLSGLMCIDLDHKTDTQIQMIRASLVVEPWVFAVFLSPSGDGLKVVVLTDNYDVNRYNGCYKQLEEIFAVKYGIEADSQCEPLSQGCFLSYDPDVYVNPDATPIHLECIIAQEQKKSEVKHFNQQGLSGVALFQSRLMAMANCMTDQQILTILDLKWSKHKEFYQDGHRTKSVFTQATILCKAGIDAEQAYDYLKERFVDNSGYSEEKLLVQLSDGYKQCANAFGSERGKYLNYYNYKNRKS